MNACQNGVEAELHSLCAELVAELGRRGLTLGTCESLTGGGLAAALTSVPGASRVFRGGLVTYASDLKSSLVGVDATLVAREGVINEATARQMADGASRALGVDVALSCTGVAGPDPQDGQPPGVVWAGLRMPDGRVLTERLDLTGDRATIRQSTVLACLRLAREWVCS